MKRLAIAGSLLATIVFLTTLQYKPSVFTTQRKNLQGMKIHQEKNNENYLQEMDSLNEAKVPMDDPRLIHLIRNYWIENPSEEPYNLASPDTMDPSIGQAAFVDNRLKFQMTFQQNFNQGKLLDGYNHANPKKETVEVQCFPLYSILLALNLSRVDFFSLDVEGSELQVLKTIPFDKLFIRMMTVEYVHNKEGEGSVKKFVQDKGYLTLIKMSHYRGYANDIIFMKK